MKQYLHVLVVSTVFIYFEDNFYPHQHAVKDNYPYYDGNFTSDDNEVTSANSGKNF